VSTEMRLKAIEISTDPESPSDIVYRCYSQAVADPDDITVEEIKSDAPQTATTILETLVGEADIVYI